MSQSPNNTITTNVQTFFVPILGVVDFPFTNEHFGHFNDSVFKFSVEVIAGATVFLVAEDDTIVEVVAGDGILAEAIFQTIFQATAITIVAASSTENLFTLLDTATAEFYTSVVALTDKAPAAIIVTSSAEAEVASEEPGAADNNIFTFSSAATGLVEVPAAFDGNVFVFSATADATGVQERQDVDANITISADIDVIQIAASVVSADVIGSIIFRLNDNIDTKSDTTLRELVAIVTPVITTPP